MEKIILELVEQIIFIGWDDKQTNYIQKLLTEPTNELVEEVKNILKIYKKALDK